ncbi:unnamed protein product [Protopolystoma xenopodis]|uniref:Uncharacterized protein n=1 Tax=Protopolystoma xenopodis TaxID=117903 RepID=A0A3S5A7B7_9PLAT|nr:unnamed protein product [Protopolystoma xenopodis]
MATSSTIQPTACTDVYASGLSVCPTRGPKHTFTGAHQHHTYRPTGQSSAVLTLVHRPVAMRCHSEYRPPVASNHSSSSPPPPPLPTTLAHTLFSTSASLR